MTTTTWGSGIEYTISSDATGEKYVRFDASGQVFAIKLSDIVSLAVLNANNLIGTGSEQIAAGDHNHAAIGIANTKVGEDALQSNISGNFNVAIGYKALHANESRGLNVAVGAEALTNCKSNLCTAVGAYALQSNVNENHNTAVGQSSQRNTVSGNCNTSIGSISMLSNTAGDHNTACGEAAMYSNTTGVDNTACGAVSLRENTVGEGNTAVGRNAIRKNITGSNNSALGCGSLYWMESGDYNVALGYDSGRFYGSEKTDMTLATDSIFIGANCRSQSDDQSNQIVIGKGGMGKGSNTTVLGNSSTILTHLCGALSGAERQSDPPDPDEGEWCLWMSDGTGLGDDGDIMIKVTAGGVTKTGTLFDFSAA